MGCVTSFLILAHVLSSLSGKLYASKHLMILNKELKQLEEKLTLQSSSDINQEANENLVSFGFSKQDTTLTTKRDIELFLSRVLSIYSSSNVGNDKLFYAWLDEMSSQIRVSAVSTNHNTLPFRTELECCTLEELATSIKRYDSGAFTSGSIKIFKSSI